MANVIDELRELAEGRAYAVEVVDELLGDMIAEGQVEEATTTNFGSFRKDLERCDLFARGEIDLVRDSEDKKAWKEIHKLINMAKRKLANVQGLYSS